MTLFLLLFVAPNFGQAVGPAGTLHLSGTVPFRSDRLVQPVPGGLEVHPEREPALKIAVRPASRRGPASQIERTLSAREKLSGPAVVSIVAP